MAELFFINFFLYFFNFFIFVIISYSKFTNDSENPINIHPYVDFDMDIRSTTHARKNVFYLRSFYL